MAETFAGLNTAAPIAATVTEAVYMLTTGRSMLNAAHAAMNSQTDAGSDTTKLTLGSFGGLTNGDSAKYWTAVNSIKSLLDADDAGGLALYLSSVYYGKPG